MATKRTSSCLAKAADDELIFVLRAQDELAPLVVHAWIDLATICGTVSDAKLAEAEELIKQMNAWPGRRAPT